MIGGTTYATRTHLNHRLHISHGLMKKPNWILSYLITYAVQSTIYNALSYSLLSITHKAIDEFRQHSVTMQSIRKNITFLSSTAS